MAKGRGKHTSTLALLGWGVLVLGLGLLTGLLLGQQGCGRRATPAPREEPAPKPVKPAEPKAKAPQEPPRPKAPEPVPELPRMAVVIDDLGYAAPELVTRLCSLPVPFSVAVLPYLEHTKTSADIAHRLGKEIMLHLPMEPVGFPGPGRDPGPNAVLYNLPEPEIRRRVRQALDEIPHRVGVNNHMGSRLTPDRERMGWILQELKARKLFFVDSRTEKESVAYEVAVQQGIPSAQRRVFLDDDKAFPEMEKQWERALKLAEKDGSVLIIGHIYPETVAALEKLVPRTKGQVRFVTAGQLVR